MADPKTIQTVKALEEAIAVLFQNSFDSDSSVCLVTIIRILDNLLHKPTDAKVRKLRLANAAVWNKVGQRKGGIDILLACGFDKETEAPPLLSGPEVKGEECLILHPHKEDRATLITARRLLETRAIQDLHMKPEQLPEWRPPPPPANVSSNSDRNSTAPGGFNVYAGHRYDAKSAAVGKNLGPDANYKSKTATELDALQQKQARLEKKLHNQPIERQWQAFAPGSSSNSPTATMSAAPQSSGRGSGDSSLLAARMQKQQAERKQREEGGFTTAAMRELEKLKRTKVYSHVTLFIQFPSGHGLRGQFLPKERLGTVMQAMQQDCLLLTAPLPAFDLYVTPPRRLLPPTQTLQQEGLVPAAKIFVSWKGPPPNTDFLQPHLFLTSTTAASGASFPTAQPVAANGAANSSDGNNKKPAASSKAKKKKTDKQEEMLKRMMGKGL